MISSILLTAGLFVNFNASDLGKYSSADFKKGWQQGQYKITAGRTNKNTNIVSENGNKILKVTYPKGKIGGSSTANWKVKFPTKACAALSYKVKFEENFDFVKGGKLPGLGGGKNNTGKKKPTGFDGISARVMWRKDGRMVSYVYHPNQPRKEGEDFKWTLNGKDVYAVLGKWNTIQMQVTVNDIGKKNGRLLAIFNGQQVLNKTDLEFRKTDKFGIDSFLFSTFFGGSNKIWAPKKNQTVYFDDFKVEACKT